MKKLVFKAKIFVLLMITVAVLPAIGQIDHSTTDIVILTDPPLSIVQGELESNDIIPIFTEKYHHRLGITPLPLDITSSGITLNGGSLSGGSVPGSSYINSHYLHFDTRFDERVRLHGSVTFDEDILGLIVLESTIEGTDPRLALDSVQYPAITLLDDRGRGLEFNGTSGDWVFISADRRTLLVSFVNKNKIDQMRVITSANPDGGGESGEPCAAIELAVFDIIPGNNQNEISVSKSGNISTTLYSREYFDAPNCVFLESLTFGRTGDELSLNYCGLLDENDDGFIDIQCDFAANKTGFQLGDTEGILKGLTVNGIEFEFKDSVNIRPSGNSRIICCTTSAKLSRNLSTVTFSSGMTNANAFKISVFNTAGGLVHESPLTHEDRLTWKLDNNGRRIANGIYFYATLYLTSDNEIVYGEIKKLVIMR